MRRTDASVLPKYPHVLSLALALALLLPGCLFSGAPDDLFPVCEDRRARGPSPTYTMDRLAALTEVRGGNLTPEEERALLEPVRTRVLTLQGASYRSFHANLTPVEGETGAWWFEARGTGGLSEDWDDAYRLKVTRGEDGARVEETRPLRHPVAAPQSIERLAVEAAGQEDALAAARERTPTLAARGLDPDLPGCAFLSDEGPPAEEGGEPARTEVAVNVVTVRVVHLAKDGW